MRTGSPVLIGLGAGLVSGVLFASAATGSALAMALFYLAPMPGFLAGFGWGWASASLAGAVGTMVVGFGLGIKAAASYAISIGLPIAILCYLALLAREAPAPATSSGPAVEWYPPGRLLSWATVMSGTLAAGSVPLLGTDFDSYRAAVHEVLEGSLFERMSNETEIDKQRLESLLDVVAHILPAASAIVWLGVATFNMWAAGRIVDRSGRALRPWPNLATLTYPNFMAWGFVASLLLSFMPGLTGIISGAFAGAFLLAFTLLGLAIVHVTTRGQPLRPLLLGGIYLSLLLFGWVALIIAIVGVGEPIFKLRARALGKTFPPRPGND